MCRVDLLHVNDERRLCLLQAKGETMHNHTQNIVFQPTDMRSTTAIMPAQTTNPHNQPDRVRFRHTITIAQPVYSTDQIHEYEVRLSRLGCVIIMRLPFSGIGLGAAISFSCHLIHSSQNHISSTTIVCPVHVAGEEQKYRSTD